MVIDDLHQIFVIWSGVTNDRDEDNQMYRKIFARASTTGGTTWNDTIALITPGAEYEFTETAFSMTSPTSNDKLQIAIQTDSLAGTYNFTLVGHPSQSRLTKNNITFLNPSKSSILHPNTAIEEKKESVIKASLYPNPLTDQGKLKFIIQESGRLIIEVTNVFGQRVMFEDQGFFSSGAHQVTLDASGLHPGLYFYTLRLNAIEFTGKMVVNR